MIKDTKRWIEALTGSPDTPITWQVFADAKGCDIKPRHWKATLADASDALHDINADGGGIYASINDCEGGRRAEHVTAIRAVFVDCDDGEPESWHLQPSIVVDSARGPHAYWVLSHDVSPAEFTAAQKRLAALYGSDASIHDPPRVMRVPGFDHRKTHEPIPVTVREASGARWSLAQVLADVPELAAPAPKEDGPKAELPPAEVGEAHPYALRALEAEAAMLAGAESARRNAAFVAAAKVSRYITKGMIAREDVVARLMQAAEQNGSIGDHGDKEMGRHVNNGIAKGADDKLPDEVDLSDGDEMDGGDWYGTATDGAPAAKMPRHWKRADDVELGAHLVQRMGGEDAAVFDEDGLWRTDGSLWAKVDDTSARRMAQDYAGTFKIVKVNKANGDVKVAPISLSQSRIKGIVGVASDRLARHGFFNDAAAGAAFGDEFVAVTDRGVDVVPLNADHRVRTEQACPWSLDKRREPPPVATAFLRETWAGCDDIEQRTRFLWQWLGLAILGLAPGRKTHLLLIGAKDTGKSRLLDIITSVFPDTSIASVAIQDMAQEYHRASMAGKRLNAVNELPARDVMVSEAAKAILSGDTVSCRHPAGRVFFVRFRCAHALAANTLPAVLDPALSGRFVVLDCPNVVPAERQDAQLPEKLRAEAPRIAWHAINAAAALINSNRQIQRPPSSMRLSRQWAIDSDSVLTWAEEELAIGVGETAFARVYERYRDWCGENGYRPVKSKTLSQRLATIGVTKRHSNGIKLSVVFKSADESWDWNSYGTATH